MANFWKELLFKPVVPKFFRAVTHIKVVIMSYYPQYFESWKESKEFSYRSTLRFSFRVSPRSITYYPQGVIYPQFGNHWLNKKCNCPLTTSLPVVGPRWNSSVVQQFFLQRLTLRKHCSPRPAETSVIREQPSTVILHNGYKDVGSLPKCQATFFVQTSIPARNLQTLTVPTWWR